MEIIAEKITVTTKELANAMKERDPKPIQKLAKAQAEAGVDFLDVSIGPATKDGPALLEWLVGVIQEVTDTPVSLDTSNVAAMEAGLKVHQGRALINSASCQKGRKEPMMELAAKYNAKIVALCLTDEGIPRDANERCVNAYDLIAVAQSLGIATEDLYLDPLILPVGVSQPQAGYAVEAITMFQELSDPPTKTTVGLSNIYNGCPEVVHSWLGGVYLAMLTEAGLASAIADPLDEKLFAIYDKTKEILKNPDAVSKGEDGQKIQKTLSILRNEDLYAPSFLD